MWPKPRNPTTPSATSNGAQSLTMASAVATLAPQAVTHMDNPPTVPVTINKIPEEDTKSQPVVPSRSRKRGASSDAIREENKKTRGRPRVEPKDETAADVSICATCRSSNFSVTNNDQSVVGRRSDLLSGRTELVRNRQYLLWKTRSRASSQT